jgi:hypothetical protein
MRRGLSLLFALVVNLCGTSLPAQTNYFPPKTFGDDPRLDHFVYGWYSQQLKALDETSLFELSKNPAVGSYRFLWLRTFHHPVAVRVDVLADGTATLRTKIASGAGGYDPGKLISNETRLLTKEETRKVVARVNASDFWRLPSYDRTRTGDDGSEWIFEVADQGRYHLRKRLDP